MHSIVEDGEADSFTAGMRQKCELASKSDKCEVGLSRQLWPWELFFAQDKGFAGVFLG